LQVNLPGEVNRGNAVFAIATAAALGVDPVVASARIAAVRSVDGRYSMVDLGPRQARVFLAKNPAGWAAALSMIDDGGPLAIGINARIADGTDTSWLYDVPFEQLAGRLIGAFGDRRHDLAVRLHYAGAIPIVDEDVVALAGRLSAGPLTVAANYTAFRDLRQYLVHEGSGASVV
jgi:UDP-N-acetylmuramyl tripeptide synthase